MNEAYVGVAKARMGTCESRYVHSNFSRSIITVPQIAPEDIGIENFAEDFVNVED